MIKKIKEIKNEKMGNNYQCRGLGWLNTVITDQRLISVGTGKPPVVAPNGEEWDRYNEAHIANTGVSYEEVYKLFVC